MKCPDCNSDMWDNRAKKAAGDFKPNSPDFKCKNDKCAKVIWPEKKDETKAVLDPTTPTREPIKERDYEAEARGKIRHGFSIEAYKNNDLLDDSTKKNIETWVEFVMTGK